MTLQEQFDRERNNLDRVYLTPEGAFLKAYERSAFILDTQWHPFKVSVKTVKYLKSEIASLGFGKFVVQAASRSGPAWCARGCIGTY